MTRFSLGVQSLDDKVLQAIGRRQTGKMALACIDRVVAMKNAPSLNVDLVCGLPGQTVNSFVRDLKAVMAAGAQSIHINPFSNLWTSRYYRGRSLDFLSFVKRRQEMVLRAKALLQENGYTRHGLEAYARTAQGNHQQARYLEACEDIVGIGINAQSITRAAVLREAVDGGYTGVELDRFHAMATYMTVHLWKGVHPQEFERVFGCSLEEVFGEVVARLRQEGLLAAQGGLLIFSGARDMEGLFEYFSWTKLFFGGELLTRLRKMPQAGYDPSLRVSFSRDGFMNKMNDAYFLMTLYDTGY